MIVPVMFGVLIWHNATDVMLAGMQPSVFICGSCTAVFTMATISYSAHISDVIYKRNCGTALHKGFHRLSPACVLWQNWGQYAAGTGRFIQSKSSEAVWLSGSIFETERPRHKPRPFTKNTLNSVQSLLMMATDPPECPAKVYLWKEHSEHAQACPKGQ